MKTQEVLENIDPGDYNGAYWILDDKFPKINKKFTRLTKQLSDLLEEVRKEFPDANYYTGSGGFNLLLGDSSKCSSLEGNLLIALSASSYLKIGDGDF